jgi:hypothetical protein
MKVNYATDRIADGRPRPAPGDREGGGKYSGRWQ